MREKPKVGQRVYLNDRGVRSIRGLQSREEIKASLDMTIIEVSDEPMTDDIPVWHIEVSGPLNRFMLCSADVDPLKT